MTTVEFQLCGKGMAHTKYIIDLKIDHSNCIPLEEPVVLKLKMALPQHFLAEAFQRFLWHTLSFWLSWSHVLEVTLLSSLSSVYIFTFDFHINLLREPRGNYFA